MPQCNTYRDNKQTPRVTTYRVQSHGMKTIGERIRQAREARKMSGEALAKAAGYKQQSAIGNLENRAGGSGGSRIGKIADALNVPVDWLLRGPDTGSVPYVKRGPIPSGHTNSKLYAGEASPPNYPIDPILREAHLLLSQMSPAGREQAIVYLRFMATQHAVQYSPRKRGT